MEIKMNLIIHRFFLIKYPRRCNSLTLTFASWKEEEDFSKDELKSDVFVDTVPASKTSKALFLTMYPLTNNKLHTYLLLYTI